MNKKPRGIHIAGLILMVFAIAAVTGARAQGYIVPNGVTFDGYDGMGYSVSVLQDPITLDHTGFNLVPAGGFPYPTTYLFNPVLDDGVRTFIVSANDPISLQPILAGRYTELTFPNSYVFANRVPFYLGFYTGYGPWDDKGNYTGIYVDPLFGWARFWNNNGVLEMLGSALEYGGGGIYVGTQTIIAVPEPSAFALVALGGAFFLSRRRIYRVRSWAARRFSITHEFLLQPRDFS